MLNSGYFITILYKNSGKISTPPEPDWWRHWTSKRKIAGSIPTVAKQTFQLARGVDTHSEEHHKHLSSPECMTPETRIHERFINMHGRKPNCILY